MKRSKRMQPVLELAQQKSRKGLQAVTYMQNRLEEEQGKLEQLQRCKEEYRFSNLVDKKQTVSSQTLQSLQQFSSNVDIAISQQTRQIQTVNAQLEEVRRHWRQLDARRQSLLKTQARLHLEELSAQDKIEQKELDEMNSQRSLNRRGINGLKPN